MPAIPWSPAAGIKAAGTVGMSVIATVVAQLEAEAGHVSVAGIAASIAVGCCVFLFGMFIKQGNSTAELKGRMETLVAGLRNDLDKLDAESRTVDKRIELSRHAWKNEVFPQIANVEDRVMVRVDENTRAIVRVDERLNNFLEDRILGKRSSK